TPGLIGVLEDAADVLDHVRQTVGPPLRGHPGAQTGEVVGVEVSSQPGLAELRDHLIRRLVVLLEGPRGQLTRFLECLLGPEKGVADVLDRDALRLFPRLPARVQGFLLLLVLLESTRRVRPGTEVVELAADLLGPDAGGVREERKVGCRLVWLLG